MPKTLLFENDGQCWRCGGNGRIAAFSGIYGGICFRCHGAGAKLTKRGRAAQDFLNALRQRRAGDFKVGDLFYAEGFNAGSYSEPSKWVRIERIEADASGALNITGDKLQMFGVSPDRTLRAGFDAETKKQHIAQALAYQATLTKTGTVRKNTRKEQA